VRKARTELQGEARRKKGSRKGQERGTERDKTEQLTSAFRLLLM